MGYSNAMRDIVENFWKGVQPAVPPATWYIALLTTNPSDDAGTGLVEVSTGAWASYARQPVVAASGWSAIASGGGGRQISNAGTLTFDTTTVTGTVTIVGFAVYNALTAGTLYGWGTLTSGGITQGTTTTFPPGSLIVQE